MTTPTLPTPTLQERAAHLLAQVQVTYRKEGDDFVFTLAKEGAERTLTYHNGTQSWQCDCDAFDGATCVHVELVKAWRRQRQESRAQGQSAPPPPATNGQTPPPPQAIPKARNRTAPPKHRRGHKPAAPPSAFPTPATGVSAWTVAVAQALLAPFPAALVGWKAQAMTKDGSRALAVAYVDARAVMDRLDAVVGPENWSDAYTVLGEQSGSFGNEVVVECRLTVLGVTKADTGMGEDAKAAYSDAFKRAAVRFGIGRYLYSLPKVWVGYDAKKRQLTEMPQMPSWAVPTGR